MSKELLPELPRHTDEWYDDIDKEVVRTYGEARVRAYGQACYEAGRKSVGDLDQILHDPENQPSQFGTVPTEYLGQFRSAVEAYKEQADTLLDPDARVAECNRLLAIIDGEKA